MKKNYIAMICKLMPFYRIGVFQCLSAVDGNYEFSFFGDTEEQGGIKQIPYSYASAKGEERIRWVKTKNFFYKPERLLWQTGVIKEIFKSKFKVFVFEGAIAHYPIWLYALLCKIRGKKVVYWTHGNRGLDKGVKKLLRVVLFKWLGDGLFLYGHFQRDLMIKDGYDPNKLHVIYNSLRPKKQFEILESIESNENDDDVQIFKNPENFTVVFIGRLVSSKGVLDILKIVTELKKTMIDINCIFIGKGPEKEKMISYCDDFKIKDQVYFAGELYEEKHIASYFNMADLMISPGNVGLNCIHSLAYGVPVLTHDNFKYQNPEVEAITDGKTGVFYKYEDFDDMVLKLKQWMKNKPAAKIVKKNCQDIIKEKYNPTYQTECIVTALNTLLNEK